jgi:pyruvate,water dikinase
MKLIKKFEEISKSDVLAAGGKGASLGEMTQANIPVPPGFVILADAFDIFLEDTNLNSRIAEILGNINHEEFSSIEKASKQIQAFILNSKFPENISDLVKRYFNELDAKFVAVRSSATAEDGALAAWAGQLESYLNTTRETLDENIKKCWASLFTPRAIFYRFEKELNRQKISVAVVVQKMINSEVSGIAFSVHPISQDKNQLIIEASYGLGEAVVSGQVTPDSYVVEKNEEMILEINVSQQQTMLTKKLLGGNEWIDVKKEQQKNQKLSGKQIVQLSKLIIEIENHYGFPCDIEWAMENNELYITQSRPITTLK